MNMISLMAADSSLISRLNPQYFWDVDVTSLNESASCRLIVERVFTMGEIDEMKLVTSFYGEKKVIQVLCKLSYIDPKSLNFISKLFNKQLSEFKCYQSQRSIQPYWNS